jgi:DNA-binding NtrC family response regulator
MNGDRPAEAAKLLLVDDDEAFLAVMQRRLAMRGFDVPAARSGEEALAMMSSHPDVDVVALDIKMPEMNGIETLKEIKRLYPVIEVIVLTGHASFQTKIKAMTYGAFDYLTKPCDLEELAAKVQEARVRKLRHAEKLAAAGRRASSGG